MKHDGKGYLEQWEALAGGLMLLGIVTQMIVIGRHLSWWWFTAAAISLVAGALLMWRVKLAQRIQRQFANRFVSKEE